ncbi:autotransporter outer membrane beta-barrel domain-containing protein [Stenotrophomonas indicatrix]
MSDSRLKATDAHINEVIATRGHVEVRGGTLGTLGRGTVAARFRYSVGHLEDLDIIATGTGIEALRSSTEVHVSRSTVTANQIGVDAADNAQVFLDDVRVEATNYFASTGVKLMDSKAWITDSHIQAGDVAMTMTDSSAEITNSTLSGRRLGLQIIDNATTAQAHVMGTSVLATDGIAVALSGTASLTLRDSHLSGEGSNGIGLRLQGGSSLAAYGGHIHGTLSALRVDSNLQGSRILLDGVQVKASAGDAILVTPAASAVIPIELRGGTTLSAGSGTLLRAQAGAQVDLLVSASHLVGNLVGHSGAALDVTLRDGATLIGQIDQARAVAVQDARWQLTADSHIDSLRLDQDGLIALGRGDTFHVLNILGDFTGSGGTIVLNTVLASDSAATDKLIIGGDTSGTAHVRVNNVGGAGAQTVQGIELIQVGGASNGTFTLAGRAVGGQYDYFLHKGTGSDGNWYLRSQLPPTPDPCDVDPNSCTPPVDPVDPVDPIDPLDPVDPIAPTPVLRPEPGAYLANLQAAQTMFRLGYHEREAGQNGGRAWARVEGSRSGFEAVSRQLVIRGNSQSLTVGADVWRHDSGSSVGLMLASGNASSTSTNTLTGYYARGKVEGEALGVYGTWRGGHGVDPYAGFYVDGSLQRAQFRNHVEGVGLVDERYGTRAWQGTVEAGYAYRVGGTSNAGIFVEPQLQLGYNRWHSHRHTEANGTVVSTDDADGLFGRAGLRLSGATRWGDGATEVQPYIAAHWLHTRAESQIRMDDEQVDARIPRRRGEFSAGASLTFGNGVGAWGGLSLQKASGFHQTSAQVGVSYSW